MYRYRYINKHVQFGQTNYSLILEDLESGMPPVRLEKSFNVDPSQIDEDFLTTQANLDIANAIQVFNDSQTVADPYDDSQGDQ